MGQYQIVKTPALEDGNTLRMWRWRDDVHPDGLFVRLTTGAAMEIFRPESNKWVSLDSYYLKRASQDPEFEEVEHVTDPLLRR